MFKNLKFIIFLSIFVFFESSASISTSSKEAIVIDADSEEIIFSKNSNRRMTPSSMSKLMTVYIVFEMLKDQDLKLTDKFYVSKNAWEKQGSKMFLEPGQKVSVEDLLRGVIVQSGNDAAIALAEGIAGSEDAFTSRMNSKAKDLGLKNSHFVNSTGWPDNNHYMSASDLALLSKRIIYDFPEYYHYFGEKEFTYNKIRQENRNPLIYRDINVDGLKTGHSSKGGYGVAASATKNGRRLILVVNGLRDMQTRANESYKLLQYGFLNFTNKIIAKKNQPIIKDVDTWLGSPQKVNLVPQKDIVITLPVDFKNKIKIYAEYKTPIKPVLSKNDKLGNLYVEIPNQQTRSFGLYPDQEINSQGIFGRFFSKIWSYVSNLSTSTGEIQNHRVNIEG